MKRFFENNLQDKFHGLPLIDGKVKVCPDRRKKIGVQFQEYNEAF
jgi:hypothetical protein